MTRKPSLHLLIFVAAQSISVNSVQSTNTHLDGAKLYMQHCASCHANGGNKIKPSKALAGSKQLSNVAVFKEYLTKPPGHMPYYEDIVKDKQVLDSLYRYCKQLKKPTVHEASNGSEQTFQVSAVNVGSSSNH